MGGRRRTILIACQDGPLKGSLYASHLAQGDRLIVQGSVPGRDGVIGVHEYKRTSQTTATWVRFIEIELSSAPVWPSGSSRDRVNKSGKATTTKCMTLGAGGALLQKAAGIKGTSLNCCLARHHQLTPEFRTG